MIVEIGRPESDGLPIKQDGTCHAYRYRLDSGTGWWWSSRSSYKCTTDTSVGLAAGACKVQPLGVLVGGVCAVDEGRASHQRIGDVHACDASKARPAWHGMQLGCSLYF